MYSYEKYVNLTNRLGVCEINLDNECLVNCVKHRILRHQRYFSNLSFVKAKINKIIGSTPDWGLCFGKIMHFMDMAKTYLYVFIGGDKYIKCLKDLKFLKHLS